MHKNEVIETKEALKIIIEKLSNTESNIQLTDKSGRFDVVVDDNARQLLKTYYESKLKLKED